MKDKYEEDPTLFAQQVWLTFVGNKGYLITFWSPTTYFDSANITQTRDHIIKSIKFLGINNTTISNSPSRFD